MSDSKEGIYQLLDDIIDMKPSLSSSTYQPNNELIESPPHPPIPTTPLNNSNSNSNNNNTKRNSNEVLIGQQQYKIGSSSTESSPSSSLPNSPISSPSSSHNKTPITSSSSSSSSSNTSNWKASIPKKKLDNITPLQSLNQQSTSINSNLSPPPLLSPSRKIPLNKSSEIINSNSNHNHNNSNNSNSPKSPPLSPQLSLVPLSLNDNDVNSNQNVNSNNQNNNNKERPKLKRENSIQKSPQQQLSPPPPPQQSSQLQQQPQQQINTLNSDDEILIKVWLPMEYTGQLYKVRKFSGGSSTLKVSTILNSQLAPMYQSTKNKLFLNNEEKPLPSNLTLKDLSLTKYDILYLRREPEYELIVPSHPQCGSLILDKDVKVDEMLLKMEHWLKDVLESTGNAATNDKPIQLHAVDRQEYFTSLEEQHLMGGHNELSSHYTLLKKLSVPTANTRLTGKLSRGYYLRLYDQKQISNYGIKIKDTLIFKKKLLNRGLAIDDAEGGIEVSVLYSPLSMVATISDSDFEKEIKEKEKEKLKDNPSSTSASSAPTPLSTSTSSTSNNNLTSDILLPNLIKIENHQLLNEIKSEKKKRKSKRTPSSVGLPFNIVHKTHVDFEYKWSGASVEDTFEFKEKLGQGGYGAVFKVLHKETGFPMAIKVLSITPARIKDIEKEIDLLKKCRCPNVLSYYGSISSKLTELWILMDYCAVGSIKDMMKTCCDTLDEEQIAVVTLSVLSGLGYLHSKGIVHLDVKGANILLTENGEVKLADFGVSQQLQTPYGQANILIGSPLYMPPEVIQKAPYNFKADIWSLGITLIELAEGRPPNRGLKSMNQLVEIPNMPPPKLSNPKDWSPCFNDFIAKCLTKDPEARPSVVELLSHDFIKNAKTPDVLSNLIKQTLSSRDNHSSSL